MVGEQQEKKNGVTDSQPSSGRGVPTPHKETNHVQKQQAAPTPVIDNKRSSGGTSRQTSHESRTSSHHNTPHRAEMTETATSPDGPYREDTRLEREFQVDYPIEKPQPRQKTKIVYDLGSPQMNTQGINASIPITTDKYTYTITSVLSSMSHNDTPPVSPTSSGKRPISSCKVITPNSNVKLGKKTTNCSTFIENELCGNLF